MPARAAGRSCVARGDWVGLRWASTAGVAALLAAVVFALSHNPNGSLIAVVFGVLIGFMLPGVVLGFMARGRKKAIQRALVPSLDMLALSTEAGLAFDGAISQVVQRWRNPFSDELRRLLLELQMGRDRKQALRKAGPSHRAAGCRAVRNAVIQADTLGVGLAKVLQDQAVELRTKRRQRAEELARVAPIKVMFPMVLLISPRYSSSSLVPRSRGFSLFRNGALTGGESVNALPLGPRRGPERRDQPDDEYRHEEDRYREQRVDLVLFDARLLAGRSVFRHVTSVSVCRKGGYRSLDERAAEDEAQQMTPSSSADIESLTPGGPCRVDIEPHDGTALHEREVARATRARHTPDFFLAQRRATITGNVRTASASALRPDAVDGRSLRIRSRP